MSRYSAFSTQCLDQEENSSQLLGSCVTHGHVSPGVLVAIPIRFLPAVRLAPAQILHRELESLQCRRGNGVVFVSFIEHHLVWCFCDHLLFLLHVLLLDRPLIGDQQDVEVPDLLSVGHRLVHNSIADFLPGGVRLLAAGETSL